MKLFQSKKAQAKQSGTTNAKPCAPASASASDRHANAEFVAHAMDEHGDMVLRLALSQMRNTADAEDAFQDVFVRLMNARMGFTSSEHLKAWLIRTTVNRCRDLQRARTRKQKQTEPLSEHHAETLPDRQAAPPGFEPDVFLAKAQPSPGPFAVGDTASPETIRAGPRQQTRPNQASLCVRPDTTG